MTVDSDNIRFMRIFAGVPWKEGVIQQLCPKSVFLDFGRYVFGTLGNIFIMKSYIKHKNKKVKCEE